jgi:hypothetical protein
MAIVFDGRDPLDIAMEGFRAVLGRPQSSRVTHAQAPATVDASSLDFKQCNALLRSLSRVPFSGWLVIDGIGKPDLLFNLINPTRLALHARLRELDRKRGDRAVESALAFE